MRFVLFYHSLVSDWNHGNAHFVRGVVSELLARGHDVRVYEPRDGWSLQNLRAEHGEEPVRHFQRAYPGVRSTPYDLATLDLDDALQGADAVIVHEWSEHELVSRVGRHRVRRGNSGYRLPFHDTHHRAITDAAAMARYDLSHYDGVLAYGRVLKDLYLARGCAPRLDLARGRGHARLSPHPRPTPRGRRGLGRQLGRRGAHRRAARVPPQAGQGPRPAGARPRRPLPGPRRPRAADAGIEYGGWLPNYQAPRVFARFKVTVHVPRRLYVEALPGIPTIRPFEALACGIPLVCSPWDDAEGLFTPGKDYVVARDGAQMRRHLEALVRDAGLARELSEHGRRTILARHTCAHRVEELMHILEELRSRSPAPAHGASAKAQRRLNGGRKLAASAAKGGKAR